jgi:hypothetical protein
MPWEFVGKSTNYTKVRSIQNLYTTLHKTILVFANIGSMEKFFLIFSVSPLVHVNLNKYKSEALFSIKLLLYIEKYYIITKMTAPLQYSVWWEKRGVLDLKFELVLTAHNRRDNEGQKGKSIYVNYLWNMDDTSTKRYLWQIFSLYTCNYGFIYLQILV